MAITTRLTERLGIRHPVLSAPMAFAGGGRLAAAVSGAGGLGLIGGGYGDADWLEEQFRAAGNSSVGCGFITWSLARNPHLLELVLERSPAAIFLSFGDPAPFAGKIANAGIPLICQVQTLADARAGVAAGAAVIVAQGAEGVVVGSRFSASQEALVFPGWHDALLAADGDATVQTSVVDIARGRDWPERFSVRVVENSLVRTWRGREAELKEKQGEAAAAYDKASAAGDSDNYGVIVGENVGLIHSVEPAAAILEGMVAEAERLLRRAPDHTA